MQVGGQCLRTKMNKRLKKQMEKEKAINISSEDLMSIQNAKANAAYMKMVAEKTMAERRSAELEAKNILLMAYLKYGLNSGDTIDNDGRIIYAETKTEVVKPEES